MDEIRAVIFDVDGVLLDSLDPHLRICEDKNREYNLGLQIPNAFEFKKIIREGTQISPMEYFFLAVGFPKEYARKADLQYQKIFMEKYVAQPFFGLDEMLLSLKRKGFGIGMVTANVTQNVRSALAENMKYFNEKCIFTKDHEDLSKSEALTIGAVNLELEPKDIIYVGDQIKDYDAACQAGVHFLGVTYGWGISESDNEFPVVRSISEIEPYISGMSGK